MKSRLSPFSEYDSEKAAAPPKSKKAADTKKLLKASEEDDMVEFERKQAKLEAMQEKINKLKTKKLDQKK